MIWKCLTLLAAMAALIASSALAVDPVIHYTFDANSLANSGTGGSTYDGTIYQTVQTVGGTPGGSTAYVAGPSGAAALDMTNTQGSNYGTFLGVNYAMPEQGTLAMWYQVGNPGYYNYEPVFDMVEAVAAEGTTNTYDANAWEAWIYSDGLIRGRLGYPNGNFSDAYEADLRATTAGAAGNWYHFAVSWDKNSSSNENMKFYVNGQLSSATSLGWVDPGAILCFGGGNTGNDTATGAYDDIRVYDSVISGSEIAALAGTSDVVTLPTPVIHYDFNGDLSNSGSGGAALDGIHVDGGTGGDLSFAAGVGGKGISYDNVKDTLTDGDFVKAVYTLADEGAISVWYKPRESYNYNSVWDNSVHQEDFECWIYGDSRVRARANNDGSADVQLDLASIQTDNTGAPDGWENEWYQITWTWSKTENCGSLYVNGKLVDTDDIVTWVDPGSEFYLGGGHALNELAVGVFDDLMIFEDYLDSAQAKALYDTGAVPEPGTLALLVSMLAFCVIRGKRHV